VVNAYGQDYKKDNTQDDPQGLVVVHGQWLAACISYVALRVRLTFTTEPRRFRKHARRRLQLAFDGTFQFNSV